MSQPPGGRGASGVCSVCGATFKLLVSSGVVWKHGHGHGRPFCAGSGLPPRRDLDPDLNQSADLFASSTVTDSQLTPSVVARDDSEFVLHTPSRATLRRIPRGVRLKASLALESRLRAILSSPDNLDVWGELFRYSECLSQPVRGGKKLNLTSQI